MSKNPKSKVGYDDRIFNTIGTLELAAVTATEAYTVSKATNDALTLRVTAFSQQLEIAKAALKTAKSNYALAQDVNSAIDGAMVAALSSATQAMVIYSGAHRLLVRAYAAAQETLSAAYSVSDMLNQITVAEAKNSYITPQLLSGAQKANATAATAVDGANEVLANTLAAFVQAEQAVWSSLLVITDIIDFQRLIAGYIPAHHQDGTEIPDALAQLPPKPDLSKIDALSDPPQQQSAGAAPPPPPPDLKVVIRGLLTPWVATLMLRGVRDQTVVNKFSGLPTPEDAFSDLSTILPDKAQWTPNGIPDVKYVSGVLHWLKDQKDSAQETESTSQQAATLAQEKQTAAAQDLAKKTAALAAAQAALAAAQQAVAR